MKPLLNDPRSSMDRLLLDANILVLYIIGLLNPRRIAVFKRTSRYTKQDFHLLVRVLSQWESLYTVPHVLAEVSNLTDLQGVERVQVRRILKETISILTEIAVSSAQATLDPIFPSLGLTDAAISLIAREHKSTVLTDDFALYERLHRAGVDALNFSHIRARFLGV